MVDTEAQVASDSRSRLIAAALEAYASSGFDAVSVREIERRANVNRGLVAHHFGTRDELWREAVDWLMARFHDEFVPYQHALREVSASERARVLYMVYARFCAKYPSYFRLIVMEGAVDSERTQWLANTHIRPHNAFFDRVVGRTPLEPPEAEALSYFGWVGATAALSAAGGLAHAMFGIDPREEPLASLMPKLAAQLGALIPELVAGLVEESERTNGRDTSTRT